MLLDHQKSIDLIISAVHLEHDGSVFDLLKVAKGNPSTSHIPFVFYCARSSKFARSVRDGLQIAARALGADKYITMEIYDLNQLRAEFAEYLPGLANVDIVSQIPLRSSFEQSPEQVTA
jgi:CheY-like chemotaxis protein